jgi:hypothetical protein
MVSAASSLMLDGNNGKGRASLNRPQNSTHSDTPAGQSSNGCVAVSMTFGSNNVLQMSVLFQSPLLRAAPLESALNARAFMMALM